MKTKSLLILLPFLFLPALYMPSVTAAPFVDQVITYVDDEGWTVTFVNGYDRYDRYIHDLMVATKYFDGHLAIKAKLTGTDGDYFPVVKGEFKCGDSVYDYRMGIDYFLYFNMPW